MAQEFFPPRPEANPTVYAYQDTNPQYEGLLKVGFTNHDAATRVAQQYPTKRPGKLPYKIVLEEPAMCRDGSVFTDHDVHKVLKKAGKLNPDGEWFKCTVDDVKSAILAVRKGEANIISRTADFPMRPEQQEAVEKTARYFENYEQEGSNHTPRFFQQPLRLGGAPTPPPDSPPPPPLPPPTTPPPPPPPPPPLFVECKNALRQNIRSLSVGKKAGLEAYFGADIQTRC